MSPAVKVDGVPTLGFLAQLLIARRPASPTPFGDWTFRMSLSWLDRSSAVAR